MPRFGLEKESGDAKLQVTKIKLDHKTVSEQRIDFTKFLKNKKHQKTNQDQGDVKEVTEANNNLEIIQKISSEEPLNGDEEDNFYKILNSKCPEGEQTATLLDQVMELRAELEARVAELSTFKAELCEVSQLLSVDPFAAAESASGSGAAHQAAALQHRIQSLCGQLDSQAHNM